MKRIGLRPDQIFYVPQKPYNVLGTLFDQVTYPRNSADCELTEQGLRKLLRLVDLEYLLARYRGRLQEEVNWEAELSLGETQRLCIARMVFHAPKFAVLDECTSACSSEMERRLVLLGDVSARDA
jgi:ABC-type uncharacterized transport system fused permease/ATPase subunit